MREAKQSPDWRREFMTLSMWEQEKFEQGRSEGRVETLSPVHVVLAVDAPKGILLAACGALPYYN